jgi:hypothetical protein
VTLGENEGEVSRLHYRGVGGWSEGRGTAAVARIGRWRHEPTRGGR